MHVVMMAFRLDPDIAFDVTPARSHSHDSGDDGPEEARVVVSEIGHRREGDAQCDRKQRKVHGLCVKLPEHKCRDNDVPDGLGSLCRVRKRHGDVLVRHVRRELRECHENGDRKERAKNVPHRVTAMRRRKRRDAFF
jgi:hypothetical protein